jgi:hypothetical protein
LTVFFADEDAPRATFGLLAGPADEAMLADRAAAVLRDLAAYRPPPGDAFAHPLGFIYLPLLRMRGATLRLHIWHADGATRGLGPDEISPMHDHTWHMTSYVICGELRNVIVDVEPDAFAPTHRMFEIHGACDVDDIRPTDELVSVVDTHEEKVSMGQTYRMGSDLIHCTHPQSGVVATLVAARRTSKRVERALGPVDLPGYRSKRQVCPPERVAEAARSVLGALGVY